MIRLGTWATVVAGAVMVVNLSAAAQEPAAAQATEQTVDSAAQPSADPPAPPADDPPPQRVVVEEPPAPPAVEPPAASAAEPPAPAAVAPPEAPAEEAAAPPVEEAPAEEEAPPEDEAPPVEETPPGPPVAQFVDINDAIAGRFFDARRTAPSGDDPNRLVIAFHTGIDWNTWKNTDFRASTEAFSYPVAMDTISFTIEAPKGFYISRVTYTQAGRGSIIRTGKAAGTAQWVVGAFAAPLAQFGTNPAVVGAEADLTGLGMTSVPVSITNGMFAFATPSSGSAIVEVNSAEVQVYLEALTNP